MNLLVLFFIPITISLFSTILHANAQAESPGNCEVSVESMENHELVLNSDHTSLFPRLCLFNIFSVTKYQQDFLFMFYYGSNINMLLFDFEDLTTYIYIYIDEISCLSAFYFM